MNNLHSLILGEEGKDLLVLHGFLGMGDNWKTHAKNWASQGWRVHLIDQRNHGRSFWSSNFTYAAMVEDLVRYFAIHSMRSATILGHSMGGKVAMQFACQNPQKVDQLIVADIAPKPYAPHHQIILNALSSLDFSIIKDRKTADEVLAKTIEEVPVRQFLLKNIYRVNPSQLGLRLNIAVLKNSSEEVGKSFDPSMHYVGKTLFLKGADSDYITSEDKPIIYHYFPHANLITINNAGHWLHAENPNDFKNTIDTWLKR